MKTKSRGNTTTDDNPWGEARHALGRLLSYHIAIKVLISARKLWPQLFVDFSVTSIPSSIPLEEPPVVRRNAKGIIERMGRNRAVLDAYQNHAKDLQARGLDERIRHRVHPLRFRPIVHAEVNLLASVLASRAQAVADGEDPLRFFHEADFGRYIGSSKPTCVLCRSYFSAHPAGVRCRETHGNLYFNWRAPDVLAPTLEGNDGVGEEGEEDAQRQRQEILERMVKEVRAETGRAIRERSYTRKKHDSRDTPSNPLRSTAAGSTVRNFGDEELASWLGQVNLDGASRRGQANLDAASMRGWGDDLASTRGQASLDLESMRAWGGESRETAPESPAEVAQVEGERVGVETEEDKQSVDGKAVNAELEREKEELEKQEHEKQEREKQERERQERERQERERQERERQEREKQERERQEREKQEHEREEREKEEHEREEREKEKREKEKREKEEGKVVGEEADHEVDEQEADEDDEDSGGAKL